MSEPIDPKLQELLKQHCTPSEEVQLIQRHVREAVSEHERRMIDAVTGNLRALAEVVTPRALFLGIAQYTRNYLAQLKEDNPNA